MEPSSSLNDEYFFHIMKIKEINRNRKMPSYMKCVCILSYRNKYVLTGFNKRKTHPIMLEYGYPLDHHFPMHAELDAFIKAKNLNFEFDKMYIYRGDYGHLPSKPCKICSMWINKLDEIDVIFYNGINVVKRISNKLKGHEKTRQF